MIMQMIICIVIFMIVVLLIMSVIIGTFRTKENDRIIWKMDEMSRDKVVTRTGGLARDRIYENIEKEDIIMDEMENNKR